MTLNIADKGPHKTTVENREKNITLVQEQMHMNHTFTQLKLKVTLILLAIFAVATAALGQPYYPTYVANRLLNENSFKHIIADTAMPPSFDNCKQKLPQPIWNKRPDAIRCYWNTWEVAFSNLHKATPQNGFVSSYIDPAFNKHIFMWDCSFMTMFGKYAKAAFNFQKTLDNFYVKQHPDGYICREIREIDGTDFFERYDPSSTGPNIMPWAEWEYYKNFNDKERLQRVFPVLLAYFEWFHNYRSWPDGTYFSSGWGCGMDNQQRASKEYNPEFDHGFMSWIDISLQQVYAANILIKMAHELGREQDVLVIKDETKRLAEHINSSMWDSSENFYFDQYKNGELSKTKTIGAYWSLLSEVIPTNRIKSFVHHLEDSSMFARKHRVPSLSADDPHFNPNGGYWNGSIWAPTNYMVLRGLTQMGFDSLAYEIAINHFNNVIDVFNKTNVLWENYAPDKIQGNDRQHFVGWTGLVPITVLFEYVFGLRPNVPANELIIDVNLTDEYGVKNYPFGEKGILNIMCKKRSSKTTKPSVEITTNTPIKVTLMWGKKSSYRQLDVGKFNL